MSKKNEIDMGLDAAQKASVAKTTLGIVGIGLVAGLALIFTTKKIFDEIFVEDDWSDVDWGEDDDEDYGVD